MGGGFVKVVRIWAHILYVAVNLGTATAVQARHIDFADKWMDLPIQTAHSGEETLWRKNNLLLTPTAKIAFDPNEPFRFLLTIAESKCVSGLFPDKSRLRECLILGNLLQSLIEFRHHVLTAAGRKALAKSQGSRPLVVSEYWGKVYPTWCLVEPAEFR